MGAKVYILTKTTVGFDTDVLEVYDDYVAAKRVWETLTKANSCWDIFYSVEEKEVNSA